MIVDLCQLAERFVALSAELQTVRQAMRQALDGDPDGDKGERARPFVSDQRRQRSSLKGPRAETMKKARAEEERVLSLVKESPMPTAAIASTIRAPASSTAHRLKRLEQRGLIARANGSWTTTATPVTPAS
jgi:predicted Rossmann fold nucleotide-binding protein DprA/Smf involved in DNA uptake